MPLPDALARHARTRDFWSDYLFLSNRSGGEYPDLADTTVGFEVCPGYALTLGLGDHFDPVLLGFVHPGRADPVEIGFDDQAHWHPHVLRWEELDLFGRCLALADPALPHPGPVVALLNRFAPVCVTTDADAVFPLIESAWRSVGVFEGRDLGRLVRRYDYRHHEFAWRREPDGWVVGQPDGAFLRTGGVCYTLRGPGHGDFPFREWGAFVASAEAAYRAAVDPAWRTDTVRAVAGAVAAGDTAAAEPLADALEDAGCDRPDVLAGLRSRDPARAGWLVEWLLDLPAGSVLGRVFGPTRFRPEVHYQYRIEWPEPGDPPPGRRYTSNPVLLALRAALDDEDLGTAELTSTSSTMGPDRRPVTRSTTLQVTVVDDRERGEALIRRVLLAHTPPPGTVWQQTLPDRRPIPLDPPAGGSP